MRNTDCSNPPLFQQEVGPAIDGLVEKIFKDIDKRVNKNLSDLRVVDPEVNLSKQDIERQLKNSLFGAFTNSLNPKLIANIKSKLAEELPCNNRQLKERLSNPTVRDVEEDLALMIAYGYQHGLSELSIRHLPGKTMTFEFHADSGFEEVGLHSMKMNLSPTNRGRYLASVRSGELISKDGQSYQKISSRDEIIKIIITIGIPLLFECLKWVFEKLVDALSSDDDETLLDALEDAIDKAEDVLDDIEDEIDDIKDDIKDLDEDIDELEEDLKDEDDKDDREDIKEEIKEKKKEKKELKEKLDDHKDAEKELEKGISRMKEARQKLK